MTAEEVAVTLAEQHKEIESVKHRVNDLEESSKQQIELLLAVRDLAHGVADNTKCISEQSKSISAQNSRLLELENKPVKNYRRIVNAVSYLIASAGVGYVFSLLTR